MPIGSSWCKGIRAGAIWSFQRVRKTKMSRKIKGIGKTGSKPSNRKNSHAGCRISKAKRIGCQIALRLRIQCQILKFLAAPPSP